jgi:hypothetical protein
MERFAHSPSIEGELRNPHPSKRIVPANNRSILAKSTGSNNSDKVDQLSDRRNINAHRIEGRPTPERPVQYRF